MRRFAGMLVVMLLASQGFGADVIDNLDRVEGAKRFGPPAAAAMLKKNGFVVLPHFSRQVFHLYQANQANFVTVDALHRTFHAIFEDQLVALETRNAAEALALTREALAAIEKLPESPAKPGALAYFAVAAKLFDDAYALPESTRAVVETEVAAVKKAEGLAHSPLFPEYPVGLDYSQFKPRGFYTRTDVLKRYFRGMSWFGNCPMRLASDDETRRAMLVAEAFLADPALGRRWGRMDAGLRRFLGPTDDLTPGEYAEALSGLPRRDLAAFRAAAVKLRDPKICGLPVRPEQLDNWTPVVKGMCFFGKRYLVDSEVFLDLTAPRVPGRLLPSGLDMMAANGSSRALELLRAEGTAAAPGWAKGLETSRALVEAVKAQAEPTHYARSLRLVDAFVSKPAESAPVFMKTEAWSDKCLTGALAAWASGRHAWQLQAKTPMPFGAGFYEKKGYVEPNLEFFDGLDELVGQTLDILRGVEGADLNRLEEFRGLAKSLRAIAVKELAGEPITEEEARLLDGIGGILRRLTFPDTTPWTPDDQFPWMSLIADVHTEHLTGRALEVGTGGAMPIFVVVPWKGKPWLMKGAVYSYYEFTVPPGRQLSDEEWQKTWERGAAPAMPAWTKSYVAGRDVEGILKGLREGRIVDVANLADPRILETLERELKPGGAFASSSTRSWAIEARALLSDRDVVPDLIRMLEVGPDTDRQAAVSALKSVCESRDLPALAKVALDADNTVADGALAVIRHMSKKSLPIPDEMIYIPVAFPPILGKPWPNRPEGIRMEAWGTLLDATPGLMDAYPNLPATSRAEVLHVLAKIWAPVPPDNELWPKGTVEIVAPVELFDHEDAKPGRLWLDSGSAEACRNAVRALAIASLDSGEEEVVAAGLDAIEHLGLVRRAAPSLVRLAAEGPCRRRAADLLARFVPKAEMPASPAAEEGEDLPWALWAFEACVLAAVVSGSFFIWRRFRRPRHGVE